MINSVGILCLIIYIYVLFNSVGKADRKFTSIFEGDLLTNQEYAHLEANWGPGMGYHYKTHDDRNRTVWLDATDATRYGHFYARYISHSWLQPNARVKVCFNFAGE